MQDASSSLVATTTYPPYHNSYYPALTAPQDFDLKRQYLALLPPPQIIEICLTFDAYVPPYAKTTIWPPDINAAIAALQKPPPTDDPPSETPAGPQMAIMDSLGSSAGTSSAPPKAVESPSEPQPPDKEASATPGPSSAPVASTSTADQNSTATQPVYPQQAYGYGHSQTAYPHAPYYPPPPAGYPYPPYAGYPPMSNGYTAQGYPSTATSLYNASALAQGSDGPHADDLPSYEEMIVEALTDSGDPEGCAPKDLFFWMASRYPLQSNFRPSASQALQKAFKRGRFEKSSGGKYRLNAAWEGGSTTRRTTRRPQTHNQPQAASATPGSPFTHAPLVHHHSTTAQAQQPFQNPYGYPYSHYGYPPQPQATPAAQPEKPPAPPPSTTGDVSDAYEAAQNILKAINFGNLLQLPPEETNDGAAPHQPPSSPTKENKVPTMPTSSADVSVEQPHPRAELQAQLALLVTQLTELAQADVEYPMQEVQGVQDPPPPPPAPPPVVPPPPVLAVPLEDEDSDDDDMEEVV